jgi:hypothetical protein
MHVQAALFDVKCSSPVAPGQPDRLERLTLTLWDLSCHHHPNLSEAGHSGEHLRARLGVDTRGRPREDVHRPFVAVDVETRASVVRLLDFGAFDGPKVAGVSLIVGRYSDGNLHLNPGFSVE